MMAVRLARETLAHFFWAALALATAWSRSAGLAEISSPTTLPVAGFSTGIVWEG